ncbi:unnamed protein product [Spirodela intermedia]|uniref:Uncharacterized protein n=1 Tax=Spirodela intermedia TaxID=51605 RepID=A0A7I8ICJ2_SPIIN|nr:unnamed protein product [Spirodela intermedia]CAA6655341.1 unnamed protein product [Spirodela intermedia]
MASGYLAPVSAVQVGSYFVGQYYQILQQQPNLVYQFYTDLSTIVHMDGSSEETASGMLQIHSLIMSLKFSGIEIKTAHSLESWSGGVLVMVSGSVQTKQFSGWRRFVQTFFLAPQEKGYFILNDIFHLLDEEQVHQQQVPMSVHNSFNSTIINATSAPDSVTNYMHGREAHINEFTVPADVEESESIDKYNIPEPQQQHISEADDGAEEEIAPEELVASFPSDSNFQDQPAPVEEPVGEPTKHTYASILRVAKVPTGHPVPPQASTARNVQVLSESELQNVPQAAPQQSPSGLEKPGSWAEDVAGQEDDGEVKSVYVRNLPSSASVSELEREFKNFGRIKPDGVLIKTRKEAGVYYAFVEFEDMAGVQNALKASPILFGGRQIHVEERRPGSLGARGRRVRVRGGGGYQGEAPRGRFGSRPSEGRDYNGRPKGNGYHHQGQGPRQDRGILGPQVALKNGQRSSADAATNAAPQF